MSLLVSDCNGNSKAIKRARAMFGETIDEIDLLDT